MFVRRIELYLYSLFEKSWKLLGKFSKYSALVQRSSALIPKVSIFTICYIIIYLGVPCSKPLAGSIVGSVFHPSEVDKMSARNFWELSSKKNCFLEVALALRQLNLIQKRDHKVVSFKFYIYIQNYWHIYIELLIILNYQSLTLNFWFLLSHFQSW